MPIKNDIAQAPLCLSLYTEYEQDILLARARFLAHIEKHYTGSVSNEIKTVLEQRIEKSETPLLGELWPWFLKKVFPISVENVDRFTELVIKWYAQYLLAVTFDDASDEKRQVDPTVVMPLIVEAADLIKANIETARSAVKMQTENIRGYALPGKNAFIISFAETVSSISEKPDPSLVGILTGSKMMSVLQFLDDAGDFDEDLSAGHRSSLVNGYAIANSYSSMSQLIQNKDGYEHERDHLAGVTRRISYHTSFIASCLSDRRDTIKDWLEKEINFFCMISTNAKSLAHFLTQRPWSDIESFAADAQRQFKVLASST